jgi:hypothetical protein
MIYPWERIRRLPLIAAERLAASATHSKRWAVAYVIGLFYLVPAALIFVHKLLTS